VCGIAGILSPDPVRARDALARMVPALAHRGPDGEGAVTVEMGGIHAALGMRRLAIIDLSPAGRQPMVHPATGDVLVYNGETYNFADLRAELEREGEGFRGQSDTEVVLHGLARWGPAAVDRVRGMYAWAFLDRRAGRLLLGRDPLGIKPLYMARAGADLLFASEVRGLLASGVVPRRIDRAGAASMLAYGAVQEPRTIFEGITAVPPGAVLAIDLAGGRVGEPRVISRWRFPAPDPSMDEARAVGAVRETLEASVRDHLVSDVPVGVFLSSGIDSTIVASLAARHAGRLRTFTVGFSEDPDLSEAPLAHRTAADLGVDHTEITVSGAEGLAGAEGWLSALDQPSMDGLNVYLISGAVRARGIVVALSGQGGDELFGGYSVISDVLRAARALRPLAWLPAGMRGGMAALATAGRAGAVRAKAIDMARARPDLLELYLHRRRLMSAAQLAALGLDCPSLGLERSCVPPEAMREEGLLVAGDPVASLSRLESRLYLGNTLLRDGDANGMSHGLEIRVPFLDRHMLELVYSIPGRVLMPRPRAGKHLLRAAFSGLIRPELANQRKRGFVLPMRRWMLGPLREPCEAFLGVLRGSGVVEPAGVDGVWQAFLREPQSPAWTRALTLCVLGRYLHDHAR
jgi:asparagine synthase (glutamine-hydrolysing)